LSDANIPCGLVHRGRCAPSPRVRGEGRGEGESPRTEFLESPPHPDCIFDCNPTSPRKRGEVNTGQAATPVLPMILLEDMDLSCGHRSIRSWREKRISSLRHGSSFPRHVSPEPLRSFRPLKNKGAGNAGSWPPPWPACRKKCRRQVPQVQPRHPGIPRAMVLRLIRGLPGDRLSCPRLRQCVRALRRHQHRDARTARLHRRIWPFVRMTSHTTTRRAHRIPHPTSVTTAKRPLVWDGMRRLKHNF